MINYKTIMENNLATVLSELGLTGTYNCVVDNEQQFLTHINTADDLVEHTIYFVIKELGGSAIFNTQVLPSTLIVLSEQNSLSVAKQVIYKYIELFNLSTFTQGFSSIKFILDTPTATANFYNFGAGTRSIFKCDVVFIISQNILDMASAKIDGETLDIITLAFDSENKSDTMPLYNDYVATSVMDYSSNSLQITIPMQQCSLLNKCLEIANGTHSPNTIFNIAIAFNNGLKVEGVYYYVKMQLGIAIGELPAVSLTFTR